MHIFDGVVESDIWKNLYVCKEAKENEAPGPVQEKESPCYQIPIGSQLLSAK